MKGNIKIGICTPNIAVENQFMDLAQDCWKKLGHEHYLIDSNELAYSNSDSEINSKKKVFKLEKGSNVQF